MSGRERRPSPERPSWRDRDYDRDRDRDRKDSFRDASRISSQRRSRSRERERDHKYGGSDDRERGGRGGDDDYNSRKRFRDLDEHASDKRHKDYRESRSSRDHSYQDSRDGVGRGTAVREDPNANLAPCSTLVLRGLSGRASEEDILAILSMYGSIANIRIIKDRDTGHFRGIAFIDFASLEGAMNAVEVTRGYVTIDGTETRLEYSREASARQTSAKAMDWICGGCKTINFARRNACFKCAEARAENSIQVDPSNTSVSSASETSDILILRGLAVNSTEDSIKYALSPYTSNLKMVRVIRDHNTQQSRGFCFLEVGSVKDASALIVATNGLVIDGSQVNMSFARPKDVSTALSAGQSLRTNPFGQNAVEQAMAQKQPARATPSNVPEGFVYDERSGWYYHATSGYYFDASTNLYYEPTQGKYYSYDHATGTYVEQQKEDETWQAEEEKPAESLAQQTAAQAAAQAAAAMADFAKKKKKKSQAPVASGGGITSMKINISQELGKWTAMQEDVVHAREVVENEKPGERLKNAKESISAGNAANAANLAAQMHVPYLQQPQQQHEPVHKEMMVPAVQTHVEQPLVVAAAAAGGGGGGGGGASGFACLLCRRKFNSAAQLQKHEEQSEMHKQAVELAKKAEIAKIKHDVMHNAAVTEKKVEKQLKRNHYAELAREKHESDRLLREAEEAARSGNPVDVHRRNQGGLDTSNNKGSEMLRKMGWTDGQGLGSKGDGITTHIGVELREERAGIGCGEITKEEDIPNPGDSYQVTMMKKAKSRLEADPTAWRNTYSQD